MGPRIVEVAAVLGENGEQLPLVQHDHVVEALAAHTAEKALAGRVHVRRAHRGLDDPRPETLSGAIEISDEHSEARWIDGGQWDELEFAAGYQPARAAFRELLEPRGRRGGG